MTQKTLLLTGASRGIGHATVKLFQAAGWRVLTVSRSAFDARCPWHAGTSDHFQGDLADPAARADLVARLRETLGDGGLNAIVNNAGISPKGPQGERLGVATSSDEIWRQVLAVNLIGPAALMRDLMPELARGTCAVVNVGSIVGTRVHPFAGTAYACSKAALAALTREAAAYCRGRGDGLLHVFVPHATAGVAVIETGAGSAADLVDTHGEIARTDPELFGRAIPICGLVGDQQAFACDPLLQLGMLRGISDLDPARDHADGVRHRALMRRPVDPACEPRDAPEPFRGQC